MQGGIARGGRSKGDPNVTTGGLGGSMAPLVLHRATRPPLYSSSKREAARGGGPAFLMVGRTFDKREREEQRQVA